MQALAVMAVMVVVVVLAAAAAARFGAQGAYSIDKTGRVLADGREYRVHRTYAGAGEAAAMLAAMHRRVVALLRHLRGKYAASAGPRGDAVRKMLRQYNVDNIVENAPNDPGGDTSYTIDKGAVLALCLRAKAPVGADPAAARSAAIHQAVMLTFVTFHELAHMAIVENQHPEVFWQTFKFILLEARAAGIPAGADYGRRPAQYCGMEINYNPVYDSRIREI